MAENRMFYGGCRAGKTFSGNTEELTVDAIKACREAFDNAPVPTEDRHILYMSPEAKRKLLLWTDTVSTAEKKKAQPNYRFYDRGRW
jgi:hypothetical protein